MRIRQILFGDEYPKEPFFYLLTVYLIPFTFLLLCAEMNWTRFLKNVQFLGHRAGKGIFLIFVSLLLFDTKSSWIIMTSSLIVALVGLLNLIVSCIIPNRGNVTFFNGMSDTEWETDMTSGDDSDIDPKEHESLLPTATMKEEVSSCYESSSERILEVDSEASFRMGKFTKTKSIKNE